MLVETALAVDDENDRDDVVSWDNAGTQGKVPPSQPAAPHQRDRRIDGGSRDMPPGSAHPQRPAKDAPQSTQAFSNSRPPQPEPTTAAAAPKQRPPQQRKASVKYLSQAVLNRELAYLESLSAAALAGDTTALDQLRSQLDHSAHIWRRLVDLEDLVERKMVELFAGVDPLRCEAFRKRAAEIRVALLEGESGSFATKMAASRVVICWLFAQLLDLRALQAPQATTSLKMQEQAERRLQVAFKTYALVRQHNELCPPDGGDKSLSR